MKRSYSVTRMMNERTFNFKYALLLSPNDINVLFFCSTFHKLNIIMQISSTQPFKLNIHKTLSKP